MEKWNSKMLCKLKWKTAKDKSLLSIVFQYVFSWYKNENENDILQLLYYEFQYMSGINFCVFGINFCILYLITTVSMCSIILFSETFLY